MLATSILFFVISGIQFWASDYMRLVLNIPEEIVFPAFSIITLTGPTLGCIIGGGLTHMFGGYNHPNAIKLILYVGSVGTIVSLPIPFVDHTPTFLTLFWLSLFSGGFIMPGMTGIMINSAPKRHKPLANSIAYVSYNLLGYVPGPLVYGVLTHFNGPKSKIGMFVLIYSLILCVVFVWFAYRNSPRTKVTMEEVIHNVKDYKDSENDVDEEEERRAIRKGNRILKYSMGQADWSQIRNSQPFGNHSFLEDLVGHNTGLSPSMNKINSAMKKNSMARRGSVTSNRMSKRFSEPTQLAGVQPKKHRRGISLFDNDNINVGGIPGQMASNLFNAGNTSFAAGDMTRRSKSIFH